MLSSPSRMERFICWRSSKIRLFSCSESCRQHSSTGFICGEYRGRKQRSIPAESANFRTFFEAKYGALSRTRMSFFPNSSWSALRKCIVTSELKLLSLWKNLVSPFSHNAPRRLVASHSSATLTIARDPRLNQPRPRVVFNRRLV